MSKTPNMNELEVFPWNDSFNTGIKDIDEQHQTLVRLLNELANDLTREETHAIEETFAELAQYADFHFKSEEAIWDSHLEGHELVNSHKHTHQSFLPKVLEIQEENKHKPYHEIIEEILIFLIRWLAFHIIDEDKRLAFIIQNMKEGKKIQEAQFIVDNIMNGAMKTLIDTILSMHNTLSLKAISLIKERKARIKAEKELKKINKKLENLSITDQLTKIYNRRFFDEVFNKELNIAQRNKTNLNVILFDIDYFKKLNDTYGHVEGDKALIKVSKAIRKVFKRPSDYSFRIGGEEFCILISNENQESIIQLTKQLQSNIKELKIKNEDSDISKYLTISVGITTVIPSLNDNIDNIMHKVDQKLYEAKETGRDKIVY